MRQRGGQRAREAGRQANQPLVVLAQQLEINARLDIKSLGKGQADHVNQIAVARHILTEQDQMAVPLAVGIGLLVAGMGRDIDLTANNRMNALFLGGAVKVDDAVHDAVVGDGDGWLPELDRAVNQPLDAAGAVEQAVFTVYMQMRKIFHHTHSPSPT